MTATTDRRAARVLLVDARERLLLFRGHDPAQPDEHYWFTAGGGLEPDEPAAAGAARELAEETGLALDPAEFGEPVLREVIEFSFDGRSYRQAQEFFLVRVASWEVSTAGLTPIERAAIVGYRWWSLAELEAPPEPVYPVELPALMRRLLAPTGAATGGGADRRGSAAGEARC